MFSVRGRLLLFVLLVLAVSLVACEYLEKAGSQEAKLLEPPSVRKVIDDADELGLGPVDLLCRRQNAAVDDLEELYADRIDEAPSDRAADRLGRQRDRAVVRLQDNYSRRQERVNDRLRSDDRDSDVDETDCS